MGVLSNITDEYFGDKKREEDVVFRYNIDEKCPPKNELEPETVVFLRGLAEHRLFLDKSLSFQINDLQRHTRLILSGRWIDRYEFPPNDEQEKEIEELDNLIKSIEERLGQSHREDQKLEELLNVCKRQQKELEKALGSTDARPYLGMYYYDDDDTIDRLSSSEVHEQVYTYTQSFLKDEFIDDAEKMLLCKPILPKSKNNYPLNNIVFEYNFRLINLLDDVQFLRSASLSVTGDEVNKYFVGAKTLDMSGVINYNVFNKIESVEQKITTPVSNPVGTQYVKVFYNTSDVVLDENGDYIGSDAYVLNLSNSSKNYKFKFRKYDSDGNLVIYDLSDYSLVLYSRDSDGKDIIINPTYSDNMNLVMGEVEFNVPVNDILKLKNVETSKRFMSILVINNDNTKYTLFDFTYN